MRKRQKQNVRSKNKQVSTDIPEETKRAFTRVLQLTDAFCTKYLNDDYRQLCEKMAIGLCEAGVPINKGKPVGWASGIVKALGRVNFLHNSRSSPYMSAAQIAEGFGVSQATMLAISKIIRDELDLIQMHPDWCVPALLENNPLVWMLKVNGIIMDIRVAPREAQEEAYRLGLIPYIPADREEARAESGADAKITKFPGGNDKTAHAELSQKPKDDSPGLFEGLQQ
jgi:hypothetical protein